VPLAGLIGYTTALRSMTAGEAALSMEFSHYAPLDAHAQQQVLLEMRGY
jgi:elongation factor G